MGDDWRKIALKSAEGLALEYRTRVDPMVRSDKILQQTDGDVEISERPGGGEVYDAMTTLIVSELVRSAGDRKKGPGNGAKRTIRRSNLQSCSCFCYRKLAVIFIVSVILNRALLEDCDSFCNILHTLCICQKE